MITIMQRHIVQFGPSRLVGIATVSPTEGIPYDSFFAAGEKQGMITAGKTRAADEYSGRYPVDYRWTLPRDSKTLSELLGMFGPRNPAWIDGFFSGWTQMYRAPRAVKTNTTRLGG